MADAAVGGTANDDFEGLSVITDPFVDLIVQINSTVLNEWAAGDCETCHLLKDYCPEYDEQPVSEWPDCKYLLALGDLEDWEAGLISVFIALFMLFTSLILMVKLLNSILTGN